MSIFWYGSTPMGKLRLLVLETKGEHLEGKGPNRIQTKFFELLEQAYAIGRDAGEVELFADAERHAIPHSDSTRSLAERLGRASWF